MQDSAGHTCSNFVSYLSSHDFPLQTVYAALGIRLTQVCRGAINPCHGFHNDADSVLSAGITRLLIYFKIDFKVSVKR